ncbi:MAG TPA: hypothetical protein VFQ14_00420 [Thermoleophilaceae bacterium]|nr:hypothetical protein [Thermoleophilaceae bacterium]
MIIRTALRQPWTAVLLAVLLLASGLALAACAGGGGGGDADDDAAALLDMAFDEAVPSADVDVDLQLDIEGRPGFEDPLRIRASGPYVRSEKSLPQLDLDVAIEAQGAGQAIESGVLSTGDRLFLKFGGAFYEQSRAEVARTNRRLARENGDSGTFSDLGLDARKWIVDARIDGEEEIGGVATEHVKGTLDVEAALTDLNSLLKGSSNALAEAGQQAKPFGKEEIERLAKSVDDPTFDVYVGKDDDVVRRISLRLDVEVPEQDREKVGGVTGASIRLSAQLDDVGGDQQVDVPRSAQPLSDLTRQLGNLDELTGGAFGGVTTPPDAAGQTGDGGSGLDDFERYSECLDAADPDDADTIATCRALLP